MRELRAEIARLSVLKTQQEAYLSDQYRLLAEKVETPWRVVNNILSNVPGVGIVRGIASSLGAINKPTAGGKRDWLTRIMQLGLPLVLNRTMLKNAGWLKKSLVLLASESAASQVTTDRVDSVLSKVANFIRPKKNKKKHKDMDALKDEDAAFNFGVTPNEKS
ncbi:hypothetical protein ACL9RF_10720 [Sphingobacterium sp. Mn56C]